MGHLESLYARLAAGTAKYRPRPSLKPFDVALVPATWTPTIGIMGIIQRSNSRTLRLLRELHADGLVERRSKWGVGYEWRRK